MSNNDGFPVTPGSGRLVMVDVALTAPDGTASVDVQASKILLGAAQAATGFADGSYVPGTVTNASTSSVSIFVDPRAQAVRLAVTAATSTASVYTTNANVGGVLHFSGAVRSLGGSGRLVSTQVLDKSDNHQNAHLDLALFDRAITAPTDDTLFNPTDVEAGYCIGVISFQTSSYTTFTSNSVACSTQSFPFKSNGADVYGYLVARSNPQYTSTNDVVVTLTFYQD